MSALTVFKGTPDIWIGKEVQCDNQFVAALQRIDAYAASHNVQINVQDSYHPLNQPVEGPIVTRVRNSNHIAGHAIDMNIKYDSKLYTSGDYLDEDHRFDPSKFDKLPQKVQEFINLIRNDPGLRWGGDFKGDHWDKKRGKMVPNCDPVHIDDHLNKDSATFRERVNALQMANPLIPKREPLKNVAKVAKHGWAFKIAVALLTIIMVTNIVYYLGVFEMDPVLQPAQQIMDQIWSAPGLAQVHQYILNIFAPGLTPNPVVQTLTGTWTGNVKIWLEHHSSVGYSYSAKLVLQQSGASVTGTIMLDTTTFQITDGRIESEQIQFKADNLVWSGTFLTNSMKGTLRQDTSIPPPPGVGYADLWVGTFNLIRGF